jgi:hypothetical protein
MHSLTRMSFVLCLSLVCSGAPHAADNGEKNGERLLRRLRFRLVSEHIAATRH